MVFKKINSQTKIIGISGNNGKTTLCHILSQLFTNAGVKCGYLATNGAYIDGNQLSGIHYKTLTKKTLKSFIKKVNQENLEFVFIEVKNHTLEKGLFNILNLDVGILTNLNIETKDFEMDPKNLDEKIHFINLIKDKGTLILNSDDKDVNEWINKIAPLIKNEIFCEWVSKNEIISSNFFLDGMRFMLKDFGEVKAPLIGLNSQSLLLKAIKLANKFISKEQIITGLANIDAPKGRLHIIKKQPHFILVDSAKSNKSVEDALFYLSKTKPEGSKLISIIGYDHVLKTSNVRGKVAAINSDIVILAAQDANDDSVFKINSELHSGAEDFGAILVERFGSHEEYTLSDINKIKPRLEKVLNNNDVPFIAFDTQGFASRLDAIHFALNLAKPNDIVYISGKGDDASILFNHIEYEWSDYEAIDVILNGRYETIFV